METIIALWNSYGQLVNSFYELEPRFVDYWNRESKPKVFRVGPLCLNLSPETEPNLHKEYCRCIHWLDQKLRQGRPVLYIAFGSQAEISPEQLSEIAGGLEESEVSFLWVGFLSHCGWNSVLESICAEVPILAWPMMTEQHLNARMVVEEIKIGLRVVTINGSGNGFVRSKNLKNKVKELMEGEKRNELRKNLKELAEMARNSMKEGGSSWLALNQLIKEIYLQQDPRKLTNAHDGCLSAKRAKLRAPVPSILMEVRAEKALEAIYVCCFGIDPLEEEDDERLLSIMLNAVFPTVGWPRIEK
ncbi:unnamed protein product [Fraxinus pennsylvanica]|uniref:Uncharacterized protein n=1 Tax=Fraxinus pennsylvanica TaxID=56036 RepID=A0AAD1Z4R4_9LAMI|nr:unnamed protein product [Fraxinus pennsylvanica]